VNPDPNEQLRLPDGTPVGTGLQIPVSASSSFIAYETIGPMLSMPDIIDLAKRGGRTRGRERFPFAQYGSNQRSTNGCQGHASANAVTRARVRRHLDYVKLSGAYAYSLVNGGRDRGSMLEDGMVACEEGYATAETVPWDKIYPYLYNIGKAKEEAARLKAREVYAVRTEIGLFSALASGFDCVVAVHADNGFMSLDSRGVAQGGNGPGNHAVCCDDLWYDGELIADMCNSWDTTYGDQGRAGLTWKRHLSKTTQFHVFYAMRGAIDDPEAIAPPMDATLSLQENSAQPNAA
jgi:hypothetical protein